MQMTAKTSAADEEQVLVPDGYDSADAFLQEARERFAQGSAADRDNRDDLREHVAYQPLDQDVDPRQLTVDGEAAPLGALAGLLLDEDKKPGKKDEDKNSWQKQVAQGQTPVGLLLRGVRPAAEQPSDTLRQAIQDALAKQNSDLIPRFNPLVSAYNNQGDALLLVPLDAATGDLETGGYYTTKDVPYAMLARLTGTFQLPSGRLRADGASVLTGTVGGRQYVIVPLDPSRKKTHLSANQLRLNTGPLTGTFQVKTQKLQGRESLFAQ